MKKITIVMAFLLVGGPVSAQGGDLGGQWKMVGWTLPGFVPVKGKLPVLVFKGDKVSGQAGCNRFMGTYHISANQIAFSPLATTRMACEEAVMQQENTFLKALSGQTLTLERKADSLTFTNADGYMLNLRRSTLQPK